MRDIKKIVLHCTQTPKDASIDAMIKYWEDSGWNHMGYHYIVLEDGSVVNLEPLENVANGAVGYNKESVHIAYVGGAEDYNYNSWVDTRTKAQRETLIKLVEQSKKAYPKAKILGHYKLSKTKKCPAFDVDKEFKYLNNKK